MAEWKNIKRNQLSLMDMVRNSYISVCPHSMQQTIAGAFTGLAQSPIRQVMERVKSVMQVRESQAHLAPYTWSGACFVDLARQQGVARGLFQGMTSLVAREIPQFAVYYPSYHIFKNIFCQVRLRIITHLHCVFVASDLRCDCKQQFENNNTLALFLAGGCTGVATWLPPILCLDAVKSYMQTCEPGTYKVRLLIH
jgi:hypothetical protein